MASPLNLVEEEIVSRQLRAERERIDKFSVSATPELATRIGRGSTMNGQWGVHPGAPIARRGGVQVSRYAGREEG